MGSAIRTVPMIFRPHGICLLIFKIKKSTRNWRHWREYLDFGLQIYPTILMATKSSSSGLSKWPMKRILEGSAFSLNKLI